MGYTTDFEGSFDLNKTLTYDHATYLEKFSDTRRMKRNATITAKRDDPVRKAVNLPVGVEGGHGTAAGLAKTFEDQNWAAGKDLALTSATAGIISAVVVGMALINWAARKGYTVRRQKPEDIPQDEAIGVIPVDLRREIGKLTVRSSAIGALTFHIVLIGVAILIGYGIKQSLGAIGDLAGPKTKFAEAMNAFPMFPLCMIGGLLVQLFDQKYGRHKLIDAGLVRCIQNPS